MQHAATTTAQARMAALTRPRSAPESDFRRLLQMPYRPRDSEILQGIDDGGLLAAILSKEVQK